MLPTLVYLTGKRITSQLSFVRYVLSYDAVISTTACCFAFVVDDGAILDVQFTGFYHTPPDGFEEIMIEKSLLQHILSMIPVSAVYSTSTSAAHNVNVGILHVSLMCSSCRGVETNGQQRKSSCACRILTSTFCAVTGVCHYACTCSQSFNELEQTSHVCILPALLSRNVYGARLVQGDVYCQQNKFV